jgi:hypothetical protein
MENLNVVALVGCDKYLMTDSGVLVRTDGLRLVECEPAREAGLLRTWSHRNAQLARQYPHRLLYVVLSHQQRVAAAKIEKALRQAASV